jgi:tetratricopeptide (TPR) repeat protein
MGQWHDWMAEAELGLGHFDAAIAEANIAIDARYKIFFSYLHLAAAHALKGGIDEAKTALTEARRLNPKLSVKWLIGTKYFLHSWIDALRRAGCRRSECAARLRATVTTILGVSPSDRRTSAIPPTASGHFGLVRLSRLGHDVSWTKA